LESEEVEFRLARKFLLELKKEFGKEDEELVKVVELKKIEEFVQELRRVARKSKYEERALVEKFKREMNKMVRRKLIEVERPFTSIEQWYKCATNLNRYWRELKGRRKIKRKKEK